MATALKQYAALYKKAAECEETMKALRPDAKKELQKCQDQITTVDGVKFHMTKKLRKTIFPAAVKKIIDDLQKQIDVQKENAEKSELVIKKYSRTFDAEILEPEK